MWLIDLFRGTCGDRAPQDSPNAREHEAGRLEHPIDVDCGDASDDPDQGELTSTGGPEPTESDSESSESSERSECSESSSARSGRGGVCDERVKEIVDRFMADARINSPLLPDFIERAIYRNVITLALALVDELASGASIEFLGHRIELRVKRS